MTSPTMAGRPWLSALALPLLAAGVACGDDDADGGPAGELDSVISALAVLPDDGAEQTTIVWGDLARATEIGGLDRPTDPGDDEAVVDFVMSLTGVRLDDRSADDVVALVPPEAAHVERANEMEAFAEDVGWSLLQVDRFVERQSPPDSITVLEGGFDDGALTDALGEPTDDTWVAGRGEPGAIDPEEITPARPIGESLWLSGGDGVLSVTGSPESAEATTAAIGRDGQGDVLGDDPVLAGLAAALDEQAAYAALLARPGINGLPAVGTIESPEQAEELCGRLLPAATVGVATGVADEDGPVILIALAHRSTAEANANAEALETMVASGSSVASERPWSELLELDSVDTTGDGLVTVARLRLVDPVRARLWHDIVMQRDSLVVSC